MTKIADPIFREIAKEDFGVYFADAKSRLDHAVAIAQSAYRSLFLVNGGAIIALLTFVGHTAPAIEQRALFWSFVWFGIGLGATLAGMIAFAFSQMYYMQSSNEEAWKAQAAFHGITHDGDGTKDDQLGDATIKAAVICALIGLAMFIVGSFTALDAIT